VVIRGLPAVVALALLAPLRAGADEVEFRNGRVLEGEVVEETDGRITLRMEGGRVTFDRALVKAIRKGPLPEPPAPAPPAPGPVPPPSASPSAPSGAAGDRPVAAAPIPVARDEWAMLWSPERRVGWRHVQSRMDEERAVFEDERSFFGPDGKVARTVRFLEEDAPNLGPRSFLYEEVGPEGGVLRKGRVENGRLLLVTDSDGTSRQDAFRLAPGFRFPMAARALVLREFGRNPGGWTGPTFDPAAGKVVTMALRTESVEALEWEGRPVDVVLLVRERGGVLEEERVAPDGRVLMADLEGRALSAVSTTAQRVEAFREGAESRTSEEERRARAFFVDPENGFRIAKPSPSWTFSGAEGRSEEVRVVVKDPTGAVSVTVAAVDSPEADPPAPEALGPGLEARLRSRSSDWAVLESGPAPFAKGPSWRLLADATFGGDRVRVLAFTFARGGRTWSVTARGPRASWDSARPYLERILSGFEWL
jgi:hypothetical protein